MESTTSISQPAPIWNVKKFDIDPAIFEEDMQRRLDMAKRAEEEKGLLPVKPGSRRMEEAGLEPRNCKRAEPFNRVVNKYLKF